MEVSKKISVIMSVYNESEEWINLAIKSILDQEFIDFELIIVNDNPNSIVHKEILEKYSKLDSRVHIIVNEINIGLTKSLNKALKVAKGKYIARMDADDVAYPSRLGDQFNFMEANMENVLVGSFYYILFDITKRLELKELPVCDDDIRLTFLFKNCIAHSSVMIRHSILKNENVFYDESYIYSQDFDMWLRLAHYGKLHIIPKPLINWRVSPTQISSKKFAQQNGYVSALKSKHFKQILFDNHILFDMRKLRKSILKSPLNLKVRKNLLAAYYVEKDSYLSLVLPFLNLDILFIGILYKNIVKNYRVKLIGK